MKTRFTLHILLGLSVALFISCAPQTQESNQPSTSQNNYQNGSQFNFDGSNTGYNSSDNLFDPTTGEPLITGGALDSLENSIAQNPLTQADQQWTPTPEAPSSPGLLDGLITRFQNNDGNGLFSRIRNRSSN